MGTLSKAEIFKRGLHKEAVEVPEWGGTVFVRRITGKEREDLIEFAKDAGSKGSYAAFETRLVAAVLCDENGEAMMTYEELSKQDAKAIERLAKKAQEINSFGEEAAKKSGTGQSAGSGSV